MSLAVSAAVLDGEAVALRPDGRPQPFQVTGRAERPASQARRASQDRCRWRCSCSTLLHLDGTDLIDAPAAERFDRLAAVAPAELVIPRLVTADLAEAEQFFAEAIERGHEGVVVKSLDAPYGAGRRGSEWIKVKPRHTLDLLVLAAEWGHGRRQGWLSNLHLGARDPATGGTVMLGKTFKGLTDALLAWQTERLLELADPPGREPARTTARSRAGQARAGGRDRLRRRPGEHAVPGRRDAEVRQGPAVPAGQEPGGSRHHRCRPGAVVRRRPGRRRPRLTRAAGAGSARPWETMAATRTPGPIGRQCTAEGTSRECERCGSMRTAPGARRCAGVRCWPTRGSTRAPRSATPSAPTWA